MKVETDIIPSITECQIVDNFIVFYYLLVHLKFGHWWEWPYKNGTIVVKFLASLQDCPLSVICAFSL
jgi:hypothetical protein